MAQLSWNFPLPRTHTGALLGNGTLGLMVWGSEALHITVGRAGFWDHRGGNDFATRTTYDEVRRLLEAGDEAALRAVFASPDAAANAPDRPTQFGLGRLELHAPGWTPQHATLDTTSGVLMVQFARGDEHCSLQLQCHMQQELAWLTAPDEWLAAAQIRTRSTWEWVGAQRAQLGNLPAELEETADAAVLHQPMPQDPGAALAWQRSDGQLLLATALGTTPSDQPGATAQQRLETAAPVASLQQQCAEWWQAYHQDVPKVVIPDAVCQEIWDYGIYKQATLTTPGGLACTLQGPFLEEYQIPPWSCDYHFNINIQMIYWPALATNRCDHFTPLWELIRSWWPTLKQNAAAFFGADDAFMLPHAVDDTCRAVGAFWTGCIDQACTAWMAQMAWLHYRYTLDENILRDIAWPMLTGALAGYRAMMQDEADGSVSFPVSVSPEFKGARMDVWGKNASFQLAACHMLLQALPQAAAVLGEAVDPEWERLAQRLPPYASAEQSRTLDYPEYTHERLQLWEGMDLIESHRHHSHLGAIYPFCTIDPADPAHAGVVANSMYHWVRQGPGAWSGWCVPWAAILMARAGNGDGSVGWLHFWREHFVNEGRGTLHDADFFGATTLFNVGSGDDTVQSEIMQMDAGMGALNALCELFVQQRGPVLYIYPAPVRRWRELSFTGVRCEGAVFVDGDVSAGQLQQVRIHSERGGSLTVAHGLGEHYLCDGVTSTGAQIELQLTAGQSVTLERQS